MYGLILYILLIPYFWQMGGMEGYLLISDVISPGGINLCQTSSVEELVVAVGC